MSCPSISQGADVGLGNGPVSATRPPSDDTDAAELLAIRLVRSGPVVDGVVQEWADRALKRLIDQLQAAVHAFESWQEVAGRPGSGRGYLVAAAEALLAWVESQFGTGTPAAARVADALVSRKRDLSQPARINRWIWSSSGLRAWVERVGYDLTAAFSDFGRSLAHDDPPAWNAIGLCLVDERPQAEFAWQVLVKRGGIPEASATSVYELWQKMAAAASQWDVGRWLAAIRRG